MSTVHANPCWLAACATDGPSSGHQCLGRWRRAHTEVPRTGLRWHGNRGFTLLEVVLATAVLAAVSTLAAMMFAQARSWNDANASHLKTMRVTRTTELMTRQWADRRNAVPADATGAKVVATPTELKFVTATPLLHRNWPLVLASYRIDADDPTIRGEKRWRIVYEESRISRLANTGDAGETQMDNPATADEKPLSTVLLSGLNDARFERYGPRYSPEETQSILERGDTLDQTRDLAPAWRRYETLFKGPIPAVRLTAEHEGKEFACVFVIERSRS